MDDIVIRTMEEDDVPKAAELEQEIFSMPWSKQGFLEALRQDTLFVTAWKGNQLAGYCGMYCSMEEGEITNVAVSKSLRRQGIGRKMLKYLLKQADRKGIARVVLEVRISNTSAIALYESLGFQNVGVRRGFYQRPKEDAGIMVLESISTFI